MPQFIKMISDAKPSSRLDVYELYAQLADHPEVGDWIMGSWAYNTENTKAPRTFYLRTPEDCEACPEEWIVDTIDIRGRTVSGHPAKGYTFLQKMAQFLEEGPEVDYFQALEMALDRLDETADSCTNDLLATVHKFSNEPALYASVKTVWQEHFSATDTEFAERWNKWKNASPRKGINSCGDALETMANERGVTAETIIDEALKAHKAYQKNQAEKQAEKQAEQVAENEAEKVEIDASRDCGVPTELRGLFADRTEFEAAKKSLRDETYWGLWKQVDEGMIRSCFRTAFERKEKPSETYARWNSMLANM
jgi:hypothetical protein